MGKNIFLLSDKTRQIVNIALSVIAIAVVVYYSLCTGSCAYLKGDIFSVDLKYVGIAFMVVIIICNVTRKDFILLLLLSAGIGGEIYLIGFQVVHDTYCPFCLAFGATIVLQFILNFEWSKRWYVLASVIAGLVFYLLFFNGATVPAYNYSFLICCTFS